MGIEPTTRVERATGFEDQGGHQTPIASVPPPSPRPPPEATGPRRVPPARATPPGATSQRAGHGAPGHPSGTPGRRAAPVRQRSPTRRAGPRPARESLPPCACPSAPRRRAPRRLHPAAAAPPLLRDRRFLPLFLCQALAALGDNLLRNALGVLALWTGAGAGAGAAWMVPAAAGVFVLPTALLSGLGGELADRGDKARLLRLLRLVELPVACLAGWGLLAGRPPVVLAALAASGVTAALFGPAKYGILPDQLAPARLPAANALVEGATFAAILLGTLGAGLLAAPAGRAAIAVAVPALSLLALLAATLIPATPPADPALRPRANLLASTAALLRELRADRRSWRAAAANALFWAIGVVALSLLPGLVRDRLGGGALLNSALLALFALGIAGGSGLAAFLCGGRTTLLPAGLGCALAGAGLLAAGLLSPAAPPRPRRAARRRGPAPPGRCASPCWWRPSAAGCSPCRPRPPCSSGPRPADAPAPSPPPTSWPRRPWRAPPPPWCSPSASAPPSPRCSSPPGCPCCCSPPCCCAACPPAPSPRPPGCSAASCSACASWTRTTSRPPGRARCSPPTTSPGWTPPFWSRRSIPRRCS